MSLTHLYKLSVNLWCSFNSRKLWIFPVSITSVAGNSKDRKINSRSSTDTSSGFLISCFHSIITISVGECWTWVWSSTRPCYLRCYVFESQNMVRENDGTDQGASFVLARFGSTGKCYTCHQSRKGNKYYTAVNPVSYSNVWSVKTCPPEQWWHEHHRSNQPLSYCIQVLLQKMKFMTRTILGKEHVARQAIGSVGEPNTIILLKGPSIQLTLNDLALHL